MAEKLEQLDWGGVDGKERWNNPELARKWKSWLVNNKKNFTSEQTAIDTAQRYYRDELWNGFFDQNQDLDIYDRILPFDDSISSIDDAIVQENPKLGYKDITDQDRRKYAINRIRTYADDDNFSNVGSIGAVQAMMDNLYNPDTVNNTIALDEAGKSAVLPVQTQNTSPSRAKMLNAGEQYIDKNAPLWLQVANPAQPWGASHPLMKQLRKHSLEMGYSDSTFEGLRSYLDQINEQPTMEERVRFQKMLAEGYKEGKSGLAAFDDM